MTTSRRVVVVGGGVSGLTSALTTVVTSDRPVEVTVLEASNRVGGVIRTSPFADLPAVDEGADAFLMRVPWAFALAEELGLGPSLTSPTGAHAYVWHGRLHRIPGDLLLGVPAKMRAFAMSGLISPKGKLRAALEPLMPTTTDDDSIGRYVRRRFGNEILENLVDPLVGSIYAADTDNFSMAAVPQIAALTGQRSMLRAAAQTRASAATTQTGPIFATPTRGMGALTEALAQRFTSLGGTIVNGARVVGIQREGSSYRVAHSSGETMADAVVVSSPARHSSEFISDLDANASRLLATWDHASVVLITMSIPARQWPSRLNGSGYLVPKPDQRWVTAASFGSNKWAHWRPEDGSMILRVSLGRDGLDVMGFDDDTLTSLALADMKHHLDLDLEPSRVRISRWAESFPQYRPHHFAKLLEIEHSLGTSAPGVHLAGASYRGIGIPACVQQGRSAAAAVLKHLDSPTD
jgi:oxygen-dependent protoporphyrinogen oxidase